MAKIKEKVKGNRANTKVTKGRGNSIQYAETGGRNISPEQFFKEEAIAEEVYGKFRNLETEDVNAIQALLLLEYTGLKIMFLITLI